MALEKNTWEGETFESLKSAKDLPCMECSEGSECMDNALRVTVMHGVNLMGGHLQRLNCGGPLPSGRQ